MNETKNKTIRNVPININMLEYLKQLKKKKWLANGTPTIAINIDNYGIKGLKIQDPNVGVSSLSILRNAKPNFLYVCPVLYP